MNKSESKYFNTAVRFDNALLSLLEKKPFEYITIREICETAEVNRSTFYLHYDNTSDLLNETIEHLFGRFYSYFDGLDVMTAMDVLNCDLKELKFIDDRFLGPYLSFVKENRRVFSAVLTRPGEFDSKAVFQRMFDTIFAPILDRFHYPKEDQNFVMMFYLNGITAIVTEWIKQDCAKSIEEVSAIIHYCIYGRESAL